MLTIKEPIIDLGNLRYGIPHSFQFTVINSGTTEMEIVKLSVGCTSCTKASTQKRRLIPGEAAYIDVVFTPGSSGLQSKSINLFYNDNGVAKNELLKFKANVSG